ncbi:MAG: XdhC family protein [Bacteroidota bacterium]
MPNIYIELLRAIEAGEQLALATLIETKGSTPQITGASALFSPAGLIAGTLGGGLIEAEGQDRAMLALQSGESQLFVGELMSDIDDQEGAICGGAAMVLIDVHPVRHAGAFREMAGTLDAELSGALLTFIGRNAGENVLIERHWVTASEGALHGDSESLRTHGEEIFEAITKRKPVTLRIETLSAAHALFSEKPPQEALTDILLYVEPAYPLPQLIITGAGHVGRSLAHYGKLLEFEVTVIDDRPELACRENIPDADHFIVSDIGDAVKGLTLRPNTYIVIVNRGHRGDAEALRECIASEAAYIGMIGSKRKIGQMRAKFLEKGWCTAEQFDSIHAPVGLSIDAKTVEEIGICIAAELVAERRKRLRGEKAP